MAGRSLLEIDFWPFSVISDMTEKGAVNSALAHTPVLCHSQSYLAQGWTLSLYHHMGGKFSAGNSLKRRRRTFRNTHYRKASDTLGSAETICQTSRLE